jgi:uncharacterized protein DUF4234
MTDVTPTSAPDGPGTAVAFQEPTSADLMQSVTRIDRAVKERRDSDTTLINYWLYFFLVSWVTFGIYSLVLFFKRINRIDRFSARKQAYYEGLLDWTERYADQRGKRDEVQSLLEDARHEVKAAYNGDLKPIKAGVSFLLTIVTIGIYGLYVLYRMNRYWWDAQVLEQSFDDRLSQAWVRVGLMRYPISFTLDQGKRRSYALYLILSIITFGIWAIVWDYKIHTDPENLFPEFHSVEDTALQTIRAH